MEHPRCCRCWRKNSRASGRPSKQKRVRRATAHSEQLLREAHHSSVEIREALAAVSAPPLRGQAKIFARGLPVNSLRKGGLFVLAYPYLEVDSLPALTSKSAQGHQ